MSRKMYSDSDFDSDTNIRVHHKKKRMSPYILTLLIILGVLVLLLGAAAAYVAISAYKKPSVDSGGFYTGRGDRETGAGARESDRTPQTSDETGSDDPGTQVRRKDNYYTFLVLGKDQVAMNTDVIMLVSYDVASQKVSIAQIPRDTYIRYNGRAHKINAMLYQYYARAQSNGSKDPMKTALSDFADSLSQSFNTVIDYYIMLDCKGLRSIVDRLGGVEITLPAQLDYDDPAQGLYIHLKKGYQVLTGEQAEQFVRFRHSYLTADIGRLDAQKLFISALIRQFKNNINLSTVTGIASDVYTYVTTDVALSDAIYFGKNALSLDMENISMMTMQGSAIQDSHGIWYYVLNRETDHSIINTYFNVYNVEIPAELFDIDLVFTDGSDDKVREIYEASQEKFRDFIRSAEDIDENGVKIPMQ